MEDLKCASLTQALALKLKHWTRLEKIAKDKPSSLLRKFVNYGRKKFYNVDTGVNVNVLKLFMTVI